MKNRLKEYIDAKCIKINKDKKKREKKYRAAHELKILAVHFGVHYATAYGWYSNKFNPQQKSDVFIELPKYYKTKWQSFYY